ncbi:phage replisome organizer N-terminal domain-containing protein [Clostridium butyricum]|uniref:phage replisome organizer N-terminal domain-containing protein n=1 Tax=Clostridium TaxID=1485 RepID=UPI0029017077|nr:phage replisome organizer N-terminal domain-containing protein [Clostridium sp.]MDU1114846.1 phage replisome organizer N-terminal domain-containing protein [Clostridium sp.]MDU7712388.1 phage replisome organizer N-terminal domain-containing protein [Clostridium butyricum]
MTAKKYYWLKLKESFFEEDTIAWLEEQENGVYYTNFYLKLCLKSLKTNGILIRNVGEILIPYDIKKLAETTRVKIDTAIVAMELFKKIGLVQILENGEIYLTQLELMVGRETSKAELMRKKRRREKQIKNDGGNNVTNELPECSLEIEKDIDKNKDKDKELYKDTEIEEDKKSKSKSKKGCGDVSFNETHVPLGENSIKKSSQYSGITNCKEDGHDSLKGDFDNSKKSDTKNSEDIQNDLVDDYTEYGEEYFSKVKVFKHFEKCGFIVTRQLMEYISEDIRTYSEKWVIEAANECVTRNKADNYGYLTGILQRWKSRGKVERSMSEIKANASAYDPMKSILD